MATTIEIGRDDLHDLRTAVLVLHEFALPQSDSCSLEIATRLVVSHEVPTPFPDARQVKDRERILSELALCPLGYAGNERNAFVRGPADWDAFRHLRVAWSPYERVVVVYSWGLGSTFLPWASAYKPPLFDQLLPYASEITVVEVKTFVLDPVWRDFLSLPPLID